VIRAIFLALLLLAACSPTPEPVAVDGCMLKEYLSECESEMLEPDEYAACQRKAPKEATRLLAGIPQECRT
jgi:hypothetical protein